MKEERQVFYLSAVKLGRKKASVLQVRVYFQSHVSLRLLDLTRENCTSTETTETRHALCLKYISGYSSRGIWFKDLNCPSDWTSKRWRFLFLSFFPFFTLIICLLVPCMLETFAWELTTTVRTSMTVKDLCHLFQFRREEVQADILTNLIFVFVILSVIFTLHTRITVD